MEKVLSELSTYGPKFEIVVGQSVYSEPKFLFSQSEVTHYYYCTKREKSFLIKFFCFKEDLKYQDPREASFKNPIILLDMLRLELIEHEKDVNPFNETYIFNLGDNLNLSDLLEIKLKKDKKKRFLMNKLIKSIQQLFSFELIHPNLDINMIFVAESLKVTIIGLENCIINDALSQNYSESYFKTFSNHSKAPELSGSGYEIGKLLNIWDLGCILLKIFNVLKDHENLRPSALQKILTEALSRQNHLCDKEKAIFKLMLMSDPLLRPKPKTLNVMLKKELKLVNVSNTGIFTHQLTSKIISDDPLNIRTDLILELIQRIMENPERVKKMVNCLIQFNFKYMFQICKALFLLHKASFELDSEYLIQMFIKTVPLICNYSKKDDFGENGRNSRSSMKNEQSWISEFNMKILEGENDEKSRRIIEVYKKVLVKKYELFCSLKLRPNCLLDTYLTVVVYDDFHDYLKLLLNLAKIIIFISGKNLFFREILKLSITEILQMSKYFLNSREKVPNDTLEKFLNFRSKLSKIIQKTYKDFDIHDFEFIPSQAVYLGPSRFFQEINVINPYQVTNFEIINYGSTCIVGRAEYKNKSVALKIQTQKDLSVLHFKREAKLLQRVKHENLVGFLGSFKIRTEWQKHSNSHEFSSDLSVIMLEYCEGGTLRSLLNKSYQKLTIIQKLKIAKDVVKGMKFLHSLKVPIIHRDLKPENILIKNVIRSDVDSPVAVVADFGIAKENNEYMTQDCGTRYYMAPEVHKLNCYDKKCDVYSFGVVLWVLFTGKAPYSTEDFNMNKVCQGLRPEMNELDDWVPDEIKQIIVRCWDQEPRIRPDFDEIENIFNGVE